jgi:hypothetical protein
MMTFDKDEINRIINRVAQEFVSESRRAGQDRVLAILAGYVFNEERVIGYLQERQADIVSLAGPPPECDGLDATVVKTQEDRSRLVKLLGDYDEVALVTPPMSLLTTIAQADDSVFEAMLVLRPLLWGRRVTLVLDFDSPKFRRNTMFSGLADALDILEKSGVKITALAYKAKDVDEGLELVTEQEVKDAFNDENFRIKIKEGAIVTQLAMDTAKELGVTIDY